MVEQKMPVTLSLLSGLLILVALYPLSVHGEPDPMARPTRPKVFTSADELRRYLDLVKDYYSLNGKARYGKRAQIFPATENPWDIMRVPPSSAGGFALRQQKLEQKLQHEMENLSKHGSQKGIQTELQEPQQLEPRQFQHGGSQLSYLYDAMAKYYDELQ
ncbi:neuropeptide Y-like [Neodiprion pinetum]|uniref:uncharacterized protein LOC124174820 n=1 Tax=Neodiprion fabricii TaxID=2872261 RepID=UPI00076FB279|nr:uncharacterized protein LOC124174820 [Neodiprion fabricii]XP_046410297.1 uncharacterized protein LOC124174820 [Neodiprion fabricii]XP_046465990.1 uncharacterized protein LOC124211207 [Neodiprion pinetum]XP_046465991.1 uncharacterized protein LOC124211207 [Neodiprion pinetum]